MSDYTLAVNWSGKDALADADAAKVISGSDFNTEFTTIQTSVNSKADLVDATQDITLRNATIGGTCDITGVPTGPTQSAGNNTTRLATTAFVTTADNLKANLASPALTGTPTAPTAATSTNTTQVATTAMVQAAIDADIVTHAALRSAEAVYGHVRMHVSSGDLYIVTT